MNGWCSFITIPIGTYFGHKNANFALPSENIRSEWAGLGFMGHLRGRLMDKQHPMASAINATSMASPVWLHALPTSHWLLCHLGLYQLEFEFEFEFEFVPTACPGERSAADSRRSPAQNRKAAQAKPRRSPLLPPHPALVLQPPFQPAATPSLPQAPSPAIQRGLHRAVRGTRP